LFEWLQQTFPLGVSNVYSIWGFSDAEIYVSAQFNTLSKYDGTSWSALPATPFQAAFGLWGATNAELWASGTDGVLYKSVDQGNSWAPVAFPTAPACIWGATAADFWVVGFDGQIYHTITGGAVWIAFGAVNFGGFGVAGQAPFGFATNEVYLGVNDTVYLWNGVAWVAKVTVPGASFDTPTLPGGFRVWGSSSADLYILSVPGPGQCDIYRSVNGFTSAGLDLSTFFINTAIWGSGPGHVYFSGKNTASGFGEIRKRVAATNWPAETLNPPNPAVAFPFLWTPPADTDAGMSVGAAPWHRQISNVPPVITPTNPTNGQLNVPVNTQIAISYTDDTGVDSSTIDVTVFGTQYVLNGVAVNGASLTLTPNGGNGFDLLLTLPTPLLFATLIAVSTSAADIDGATTPLNYSFTTAAEGPPVEPPFVADASEARGGATGKVRFSPWSDWEDLDLTGALWFNDFSSWPPPVFKLVGVVHFPTPPGTTNPTLARDFTFVAQNPSHVGGLLNKPVYFDVPGFKARAIGAFGYMLQLAVPDYIVGKAPPDGDGSRRIALEVEHALFFSTDDFSDPLPPTPFVPRPTFALSAKFRGFGAPVAGEETQNAPIGPAGFGNSKPIAAMAVKTAIPVKRFGPPFNEDSGAGVVRYLHLIEVPDTVAHDDAVELIGAVSADWTPPAGNFGQGFLSFVVAKYRWLVPPWPIDPNTGTVLGIASTIAPLEPQAQPRTDKGPFEP
jgi:hypothetical protein